MASFSDSANSARIVPEFAPNLELEKRPPLPGWPILVVWQFVTHTMHDNVWWKNDRNKGIRPFGGLQEMGWAGISSESSLYQYLYNSRHAPFYREVTAAAWNVQKERKKIKIQEKYLLNYSYNFEKKALHINANKTTQFSVAVIIQISCKNQCRFGKNAQASKIKGISIYIYRLERFSNVI